jgi:hypothetical protein
LKPDTEVVPDMKSNYMTSDLKAGTTTLAEVPNNFRRLRWDELVARGDWVVDGQRGFEPWEGPGGFRADAFLNPIYRKKSQRPAGAKQLS